MLNLYDYNVGHIEIYAAITLISAFALAALVIGVFMGQCVTRPLFAAAAHKNKAKKGKERRNSLGRCSEIYVGNLSYNMTEKDVRKVFQEYGKVNSVRLIRNRFNGKSKGFGFVEMADASQGADAIDSLHNKEVSGRKIIVNEAKSSARG